MSASVKAPPVQQDTQENVLPPLNFIYSCSFCCATFADIYEGHSKTVEGFSDGINPKDRLVTKLFLASCCHVICGKHLDGGAPPFHPGGERPKAPCPTCVRGKGDKEPRELFSIRGFKKGEYDAAIPPSWFVTPPVRLDGNGQEMEALRFQYLALIRYSQNAASNHKTLNSALIEAENKSQALQDHVSQQSARLSTLEKDNQQLRGIVEKLRTLEFELKEVEAYRAKKAAIHHYLKLIPKLVDQNDQMQKRLAYLGFAMALEPIPPFREPIPLEDLPVSDESPAPREATRREIFSSYSPSRFLSAANGDAGARSTPLFRRPLKRQRLDSAQPQDKGRVSSQDQMPPPPKPLSRMGSMRKMFPKLRSRGGNEQSTPLKNGADGRSATHLRENAFVSGAPSSEHTPTIPEHGDMPFMSGALPPLHSPARLEPLRLPSDRIYHDPVEPIVLSSSPTKPKEHASSKLPAEPSYLRLMDDLSRDDKLELGLHDPRQATPRNFDRRNRQVTQALNSNHILESNQMEMPQHWRLGHPLLHQYPRGLSASAYCRSDAVRFDQANDVHSISTNEPTLSPVTPSPNRRQQATRQIESVVSPFFKSSHRSSQSFPHAKVAERGNSSHPSGVYRSPGPVMVRSQAGWRESGSLNGLSFFDSPLNAMNEPIGMEKNQRDAGKDGFTQQHYQTSNVDGRGFITRPSIKISPFNQNNVSSRHLRFSDRAFLSRRTPHQPISAMSFPSRSGVPSLYPKLLASTRPSITASEPIHHPRHEWNNLGRAGGRSSRSTNGRFPGYASATPTSSIFSGGGHRHVRR